MSIIHFQPEFRPALPCVFGAKDYRTFRELSQRMADSHLFQWFTYTGFVDAVRPVSKSSLERFEKLFDADQVTELIHQLNRGVASELGAQALLYEQTALRFDEIFADSTCVKANIHFPVDWVLLRDATRTLVQSIVLIRRQGLRHRIGDPKQFIKKMNKLNKEGQVSTININGQATGRMLIVET